MEAYVPFDASLYSYRKGEILVNSEVNGEKTSGHRTTRNFILEDLKMIKVIFMINGEVGDHCS